MFAVGEGAYAFLYCASFCSGDPRIEQVLRAVERVLGVKLTHYIGGFSPKKIKGSRAEFVTKFLSGDGSDSVSGVLCPPIMDERLVTVEVLNMGGLIKKKGDPYRGFVQINSLTSGLYESTLASALPTLVKACDAFHGLVSTKSYAKQFLKTSHMTNLLSDPVRYRSVGKPEFELDVRTIHASTPSGQKFETPLLWVNYWSEASMRRFKLPDAEFEKRFTGLVSREPGGWVVRLSKNPPDLAHEPDRRRIEWLYCRLGKPVAT